MEKISYSAHISNKKSAINSKVKLAGVAKHNLRKYHSSDYSQKEVVLLYGTDNLMKELLPEGGTPEELELVNVDTYVTENFPPVYLMTAEKDFLKEQAPLLEKVLKEKKVPYTYSCYEGTKKKLGHVFHLNMKLADADRCNDAECDFFRQYCR